MFTKKIARDKAVPMQVRLRDDLLAGGQLPSPPTDWEVTYQDVYDVLVRMRRERGPYIGLKVTEVCQVMRRYGPVKFEFARVAHLRLKVKPLLLHGVHVTREVIYLNTLDRFSIDEDIYQKKHRTQVEQQADIY